MLDYLNKRELIEDADPFLIYFGFSHPHDVRDGTPELLKKYGAVNHRDKATLPPANAKQPNLPINWLPKHPFHHGHPGLRDAVKVRAFGSGVTNAPYATRLVGSLPAANTSTNRLAACLPSSKRWAS